MFVKSAGRTVRNFLLAVDKNLVHSTLSHVVVLIFLQMDGMDLFSFVVGYQSWADYLSNIEQDGTWGDHVILYAAANCYETCIRVISSLPHHQDLTIEPADRAHDSSKPLVLGHVRELHYVSLQPKQGKVQYITPCTVSFLVWNIISYLPGILHTLLLIQISIGYYKSICDKNERMF